MAASAAPHQRAQHGHRRESGQTGAAQRLEQKGLGLVLGVMGGQKQLVASQSRGDGIVAGASCGGFRALHPDRGHIHVQPREADVECGALRPAVRRPVFGFGLHVVTDVDRAQYQLGVRVAGRVQQRRGVATAAVAHRKPPGRRRQRGQRAPEGVHPRS